MKNLIFLCIASAIFIFSVIVLNVAPTINGLVGKGIYASIAGIGALNYGWADISCSYLSNLYNDNKDKSVSEGGWTNEEDKDYYLDLVKEGKNNCLKKQAMIGLEYSAFNINVIFSFICAILGILLYSGNSIGKIVGLIGLGTGVIGFVLTFIYIIYSGIIFNNDVVDKKYGIITGDPYADSYVSTKPDGAFLKYKDDKYVCIYYSKNNKDKLYRKYSDYGNMNLNYYHLDSKNKDDDYYKYSMISNTGESGCAVEFSSSVSSPYKGIRAWNLCKDYDEGKSGTIKTKYKIKDENGNEKGECDKIYLLPNSVSPTREKKKLYNYWVTTIVFGCFIFILDIGLAIFGFLIFKDSKGAPGAVPIK
jgi:uncharacterized membrane protein (DUF485 family)